MLHEIIAPHCCRKMNRNMGGVHFLAVILLVFVCVITSQAAPQKTGDLFELPIVHLNDFHARFEETSVHSTACKSYMKDCIGGFSRLFTLVRKTMEARPNAIFLNAGDNFQGTLWYTIHKWNVTQYFLNMLPTDAMTLGNHEFDDRIEGVVPFIKAIKAPMVVANIDDRLVPEIQGLYKKSTVVERGGKKIGIIGVILSTTDKIANTGKLKFTNESIAVSKEAERLKKEEKCDIIIVLSHCGLQVDREIAAKGGPHVNVIVGGHSHSFLYHGKNPPGPDTPEDDYPVVVRQDSGRQVLVVQASCFTKYLGNVTVFFDKDNEVQGWEGNPIFLSNSVPQDKHINELLQPWKESVDAIGLKVLGYSRVILTADDCRIGECSLGSFVTDAMIYEWLDKASEDEWTYAPIAIINSGGLRTAIEPGVVTYADLLTSQPFQNSFDVLELPGAILMEMLEYSVSVIWDGPVFMPAYMLQFSGIHVTFNASEPVGHRVQEALVRCGKCRVPTYEPINMKQYYRMAINNYLVGGGDGFAMIAKNMRNHIPGGRDIDILTRYIARESPIIQGKEQRIKIVS